MDNLKDRILAAIKVENQHIGQLMRYTTENGDVIRNDVIQEAIESLVSEGKILFFPMSHPYCKGDTGYKMPDAFYRPPIDWGWESYLKLVCPWDGVEKKFSSGDWVYNSWRRNLGDEMRWVREPIPKEMRDRLKIQRAWVRNYYWEYSLVASNGSAYTLREETNESIGFFNCD